MSTFPSVADGVGLVFSPLAGTLDPLAWTLDPSAAGDVSCAEGEVAPAP